MSPGQGRLQDESTKGTDQLMADDSNKKQASENAPNQGGDSSTAVLDKPAPTKAPSKPKPGLLPPYKVLLHNDDVNEVDHVIVSLLKVTPLNMDDAIEKILEAHNSGLSLLLVTHQELAEMYQEQLTSLSLIVTIEPDA
ncbi:MAG: hypothetical protein DHS20C16_34950 [Phycisphaerae bacterium]|nr:MAG: hypothetical protein DHS20C16_34950 [Phycisphaerae bacterium]